MMPLIQQIVQLLIAIFGLVAGLVTLLAAITKLLQAIVGLMKEVRKGRKNPRGAASDNHPETEKNATVSSNGAAKNGAIQEPVKDLLRNLERSITRGKQTYIEIKPRKQERSAEESEPRTKD